MTKILVALLLVVILLSGACIYSAYALTQVKQENQTFKTLLGLSFGWGTEKQEADDYYDLATLSYERSDYNNAELNCKLARAKYSAYTQLLKEEKVKLADESGKVFELYDGMLRESITLNENLYEACEWLETASRHYAYYYQKTTPYDDPSFEQGDAAIDESNKKIDAHDDAVKKYNSLLAEYNLELNKLLDK